MRTVDTIATLEALYDAPGEAAIVKVTRRLTPSQRLWIERSRFCIVATAGPEGIDASPRGDEGKVVEITDESTLLLPDWRGNNRIDSLRNILHDARISLMFMVPGADNVMRVNGTAVISDEADLLARFERDGKRPRTVIVVTVGSAFPQCARAIMRAELWAGGDRSDGLPSVGDMLSEARAGFDGKAYDISWPARAKDTMW